jgi:DNA polymerase-3 subunit epsilon
MKLNLTKPLVIFDLETTGLDIVKARIIQISYIKVYPDGREERGNEIINPEEHIPPFITQLTGLSDEDVKDKPTFKEIASKLASMFTGCDFGFFNNNAYDIPLLAEEFLRAGIDFDFSKSKMIDAMNIFRKMERRNLASAYKFYCGRKMEDDFEAHRADQDTEATYRVLMGELDKYAPGANPDEPEKVLENDMQFLHDFSKMNNNVDFAGRIIWAEVKDAAGQTVLGEDGKPKMIETLNFGKYKGMPVMDVLNRDPGYYGWILGGDFTYNTKQVLTRIGLASAKLNG